MGRGVWMKKLLDTIWEPFDRGDSTEWILITLWYGAILML